MTISGTIKLFNHLGEVVEHCSYHGKEGREKIIRRWRSFHAGLFHVGVAIQVCPKTNTERVMQDGTNTKNERGRVPEFREQGRLIRPAANYTNLDQNGYGIAKSFING